MKLVGLFARADHPPGYGFPPREGEGGGRAHGYVVLMVRCKNRNQLGKVVSKLRDEPFYGVREGGYADGKLNEWYGGKFDHIATFPDTDIDICPGAWALTQRFRSLGDNRFVGIFKAKEVLK